MRSFQSAKEGTAKQAHHQRASRPLGSNSNISAKMREAGTLPRSPRFIWRAGTPEAPLQWPSGTDHAVMDAHRQNEKQPFVPPWNLFRKSAQQMLQQERNKGREKMDTIYSELYISTYK